jgi:hypothetical protein
MLEETYTVVTEAELLSKISDTENNFIERKTARDTDGWLKTAVAFANSCPVGQPGILYVGVDDNGSPEKQADGCNFETLQKTVSKQIAKAWPPIYFTSRILGRNGREFIAVVVYGSPERPHFSGPAYIRVGPETRDASEQEHEALIAQRSGKVRALQKLVGQPVSWRSVHMQGAAPSSGTLTECNQFYVVFEASTYERCFPLDWVKIAFEPDQKRYMLIVDHL